jgi:hypothetical protein
MIDIDPLCRFVGHDECPWPDAFIRYFENMIQNLFKYLNNPSNWVNFNYDENFDKNILDDININHNTKIQLILSNSTFIDKVFIDSCFYAGFIRRIRFYDKKDLNYTYFYNSCISGVFNLVNFCEINP